MRSRSLRRVVGFAVAAALAGCGGADDGGDDDEPVAEGDGLHAIEVARPGGGEDRVWIYAASPAGEGPFPVVVYGHGQGAGNFLNCSPDRPPDDGDAIVGQAFADALAAEGYLAIAVYYRNRGEGVPAIDELRPRDAHVLDARAFLAAARWARDRHGAGSARAAITGVSMGSFPALWATAPLPELADLQDGLELTTAISMGMLGNHVANNARGGPLLTSPDVATRAGAISLATYAAVATRAAAAGLEVLGEADLDADVLAGVTAAGAELFRRGFLAAPDPALDGCAGLDVVAACDGACFEPTLQALLAERGLTDMIATDWLTQDSIDAMTYWSPPDDVDPGAGTDNAMLARWRAISPAYALEGPLVAPRLLPLVSTGDNVVTDQLEGGDAAADLLVATLRATGASIPDPVPVVDDPSCGHGDYVVAARPECGYDLILAELAAAFAE